MKPYRPTVILVPGGRPTAVGLALWRLLDRSPIVPIVLVNTAQDVFNVTLPAGLNGDGLRPILIVPPRWAKWSVRNGVPKPRGIEEIAAGVGAGAVPARAFWAMLERIRTIDRHIARKRQGVLSRGADLRGDGLATIAIGAYGGATSPGASMALASHVDSGAATTIRLSILHPGYPYPDPELADAIAFLQMKEYEIAVAGCDVFGPRPITRGDIEALHAIEFAGEGEQGAAASPADSMGVLADLVKLMVETCLVDELRKAINVRRDGTLQWDALGHVRLRLDPDRGCSIVREMTSAKIRRMLVQAPPAGQVELPDVVQTLTVDALLDRIALDGGAIGDVAVEGLARRFPPMPFFARAADEVLSFEANVLVGLVADFMRRADGARDAVVRAVRDATARQIEQFGCLGPTAAMLATLNDGYRQMHQALQARTAGIEEELAQREQMLAGHLKPWFWGRWSAYSHYVSLLREKAQARIDQEVTRQAVRAVEELQRACQLSLEAIQQAEVAYAADADQREERLRELSSTNALTGLDLEVLAQDALQPRADQLVTRVLGRVVTDCERRSVDTVLADLDRFVGEETEQSLAAQPLDLSTMWDVLSVDQRRQFTLLAWRKAQPPVPIKDDVVDLSQVAFVMVPRAHKRVAEQLRDGLEAGNQPNLNATIVEELALSNEIVLVRMIRGIGTKDLRGFEDWQAAVDRVVEKTPPQRMVIHPLSYIAPFPHDITDRHVAWLGDAWASVDPKVTITKENFHSQLGALWKRNHRAVVDKLDALGSGLKAVVERGWEV